METEPKGNKRNVMKIRVAACDTEFMGNVSNARYFEWFSRGRIEYYRECGALIHDNAGVHIIGTENMFIVVANINCRFHSPCRFDDLLELITTVTHVGEHSIVFKHELFNSSQDSALAARAEITHVCIDPNTRKKVPIPASLKKVL